MDIVLDFKLVLLFRLCYILDITSATYYDQYDDPPNNQESQSQENTSDMDQRMNSNPMRSNRNRNNNYNSPKPPVQQQVQVIPMSQMQSMPMPMQMQMPMQIPQPPQQPLPQMSMPMPQMGMPQVPQMPMPSMPMQQMPMSSIPMPQMSMPMLQMQMPMQPSYPAPFPGQFQGSSLIYFPMSSQFTNFLKNLTPPKPSPPAKETTLPKSTTITTTTTPATTTTTTPVPTTTTTAIPQTKATTTTTETPLNNFRQISNMFLKRDQNNILASVLKHAIDDYSNIIMKTPEKPRNVNNRFILTSLRKTQPTWVPKFGIVPIPNNMAQSLMTQMRDMKGIRRRPKRFALFETKSLLF